MRVFAAVVEAKGFTAAARGLRMPKQTVSRRIAALEEALGAKLLHRTTRRLTPTPVGAAYAERCGDVARLADEANRAVTEAHEQPRGVLRVTADPVFGEAFLGPLLAGYALRFPDVRLDVVLTRRKVDLVDEGFDVAFRVGPVDEASSAWTATRLGSARVRYCASPAYVRRCGKPAKPEDLARHECVLVTSGDGEVRWPFRGPKGPRLVAVDGRLKLSSFVLASQAVRAGLGIAIFPEFACFDDVRRRRLVPVLEDWTAPAGGVYLLHVRAKYLTARVQRFVERVRATFAARAPWITSPSGATRSSSRRAR
jgi:DNA-binding transcriptional LysR family regulator